MALNTISGWGYRYYLNRKYGRASALFNGVCLWQRSSRPAIELMGLLIHLLKNSKLLMDNVTRVCGS